MRWVPLCLAFTLLVTLTGNIVLGQSEEKTFDSTNFQFKVNYPSDWTVQVGDIDFSPGIFDYSVVVPDGFGLVGTFCPTKSGFELESESVDCYKNSPIHIEIDAFKLSKGTTLEEFSEGYIKSTDKIGPSKNIESKKIEISGLLAYQTLELVGTSKIQDDINNLLDIENGNEGTKVIATYVVNNDIGYRIFMPNDDFEIFDQIGRAHV